MQGVWIEVALNGAWSRAIQPGIPDTIDSIIDEGIACGRAGAAIVHTHAYVNGGTQTFDWQVYARIIEGIRSKVDALVYPSYPTTVGATANPPEHPGARFEHLAALQQRGLLDFAVIDPGSVNFTLVEAKRDARHAGTYFNTETQVRHALEFAARCDLHPAFAIYEPGFARAGAALARASGVRRKPIYRFMFSEKFAFGFPPKPYALDAYLALLEEEAGDVPWMVAGVSADIIPLIPAVVARRGHVRVGLEDAPLGTPTSNLQWVEQAVKRVRENNAEPATASEVRRQLASLTAA